MKKIPTKSLIKILRKVWEQEFCHLYDYANVHMDSWINEKYGISVITDDYMNIKKFVVEDEQKYLIFMLKYSET